MDVTLQSLLQAVSDAARTSVGFFWKSGWAFVLGYAISGMIQAFVPRKALTARLGGRGAKSIGLAAGFGAISSSCSFAALAAARSLVAKGASLVAAVAFMFASTNLVIELGILILIFLGWPYLAAEVVGGLVLIGLSTTLIRLTAPSELLEEMRAKAEEGAATEAESFDWKERITSLEGWRLAGHRFVKEWAMVWEEIAIGFTVAGFMAVLVPDSVWRTLFLADVEGLPRWLVAVENAIVGPLVAASTFIGSMGNIPLATVLASSGAAFAGIMAFIYSDLMVPPLVRVNARYYGWRGALWIAGVMFLSIVSTALLLDTAFVWLDLSAGSPRSMEETTRFAIDYTFWLNLAFAGVAAALVWLHRGHLANMDHEDGAHGGHDHGSSGSFQRVVVLVLLSVVGLGLGLDVLELMGVWSPSS